MQTIELLSKETGAISLVQGDLCGAIAAIELSGRTVKFIYQNLFWAFIYNLVLMPLTTFGLLNPMFIVLKIALSSVSVVFKFAETPKTRPI